MLHFLLIWTTVAAGCGQDMPPPRQSTRPATTGAAAARPERPAGEKTTRGYDLGADEPFGGHTLERHIGKSDAELADRLRREPGISAASTYTDRETAERIVAGTIEHNRGRLQNWSSRSGPRPNLVLTYRAPRGPAIGRSLARGSRTSEPCTGARVVIRWHDRAGRWIVLTSYPETE